MVKPHRPLLRPLRRFIWGMWAAVLLCVLVPAGLQAAGAESDAPAIVGTIFGLIGLVLLPVFYYLAWRYRKAAARLTGGQCWVHWTYSRSEWERFLHAEWALTRSSGLKLMLYLGAAGVGSGLLVALAGADLVTALVIGAGAAALFGGLIPGLLLFAAHQALREGLRGEPVAWVGEDGAVLGGRFIPLGAPWLRSITLVPGTPAVLRFVLHGKASFGESPSVRIPVPAGKEAEAATARDRFRAHMKTI